MSTFADGLQPFGIPDSPIVINTVDYPAESIVLNSADKEVVMMNGDGEEIAARYIKTATKGTAKVQLEESTTVKPTTVATNATTGTFTLQSTTFYINSVSTPYVQGGFTYCDISFTARRSPA